jgi:TRAP-type C4-dicarboxylate transport system substrate-binding protein
MDAALTSSTSLISFRLEEVSKALTTGRSKSYWFMFEPLLISKDVFDKLPKAQQDAIMTVGAELEKFAVDNAKADDNAVAAVYAKKGAKVSDLDDATLAEVAGARQAGLEGLLRQERELRQAAGAGAKAAVSSSAQAGESSMSHDVDIPGVTVTPAVTRARRAVRCRGRSRRSTRSWSSSA